jgi:hypothetical protein
MGHCLLWVVLYGKIAEVAQIIWLLFSTEKGYVLIFGKK